MVGQKVLCSKILINHPLQVYNKGLTFAVDLSFLVADSSGVQLLVANGAVEAVDVPALERERERESNETDTLGPEVTSIHTH